MAQIGSIGPIAEPDGAATMTGRITNCDGGGEGLQSGLEFWIGLERCGDVERNRAPFGPDICAAANTADAEAEAGPRVRTNRRRLATTLIHMT